VGVVNLAVLAYVSRGRASAKKVISFLKKKLHPREDPGYAYEH